MWQKEENYTRDDIYFTRESVKDPLKTSDALQRDMRAKEIEISSCAFWRTLSPLHCHNRTFYSEHRVEACDWSKNAAVAAVNSCTGYLKNFLKLIYILRISVNRSYKALSSS